VRIGILGSGTVGRTLGTRLTELGHDVRLGSKTPDKSELRAWKSKAGPHASTGTFAETADHGELLMLCCLGSAAGAVIDLAEPPRFEGKVLIDVTNPLDFSHGMPPGLLAGATDSLGEQIQRKLPGARVVKCLNTAPATRMVRPAMGEGEGTMFLAGDDPAAKARVVGLLGELGWHDAIDVGGIEGARWLEALVPLWVRVGAKLGSFDIVFRVVR
jgi:8-hydroxy-5-deazaflavin:NADPH oxidoreductase